MTQENSPTDVSYDKPLIPTESYDEEDGTFIFDEDGALTLAERPRAPEVGRVFLPRACSLNALDGSWLIQFTPRGRQSITQVRGPMRIEVEKERVRISGDIYVEVPVFERPRFMSESAPSFPSRSLVIRRNWYPAYPKREYRWYFRSRGVRYSRSGGTGSLFFRFTRYLWDKSSEEFAGSDSGWIRLGCSMSPVRPIGWPQPTLRMNGSAMIGGTRYNVTATKTSPYYRGAFVEVDVMRNRNWPGTAENCDENRTYSFRGVYRDAGLDMRVVVDEVDIPVDAQLTRAELHTLLANRRSRHPGGNKWHVWLLVGSRQSGSNTLGIMFDTNNPPHREGAVGFHDVELGNSNNILAEARGEDLGDVPLAFLRTLIHEAGHAFNLFHPKADTHSVSVGRTIMNQTGDIRGFATTDNPFPCNATMAFNRHNRRSLVHSPDPQVKPGWKQFGWGHGSAFGGVPSPVDVLGLGGVQPVASGLRLDLTLPQEAHRGEYIIAEVKITNVGDTAQQVTTALNLAEGDLRMSVVDPSGSSDALRDVAVVCSGGRWTELQPNKSITANIQLFYTNQGFKFDQPGRYSLQAEADVGDGSLIQSERVEIVVRPATQEPERDLERLTMNDGVGMSLALGDFGSDMPTQEKLTQIMDDFGSTDTGAACAMVVANSLGQDFRDLATGEVAREADAQEAERALDIALEDRTATSAACLASTVVSPGERDAPLLDQVQTRFDKAPARAYKKADLSQAEDLLSDYFA